MEIAYFVLNENKVNKYYCNTKSKFKNMNKKVTAKVQSICQTRITNQDKYSKAFNDDSDAQQIALHEPNVTIQN